MNVVTELINKKDWYAIANQYTPKLMVHYLSFKEGMLLAYQMLFNEERDDGIRDYAAELLEEIRKAYPNEWSGDWRNDVFLGDACYLTMRFEERYEAYKRAYQNANPPPPSLLISLASCYLSAIPRVSLDDAEKLVIIVLEQEISIDRVVLFRGIYAKKKDQAKFDYWDRIYKEVEEKQVHTKDAWPKFLCVSLKIS